MAEYFKVLQSGKQFIDACAVDTLEKIKKIYINCSDLECSYMYNGLIKAYVNDNTKIVDWFLIENKIPMIPSDLFYECYKKNDIINGKIFYNYSKIWNNYQLEKLVNRMVDNIDFIKFLHDIGYDIRTSNHYIIKILIKKWMMDNKSKYYNDMIDYYENIIKPFCLLFPYYNIIIKNGYIKFEMV